MNNETNTSIYYTVQKGYEIFGEGLTKEEAWEDAKEWIDKDSPVQELSFEELPSYSSANEGEFCIVESKEYNQ
tara:strand:+ start:284 stop:502 length:219 start_codon:yes stop_codon:yes gene_type:complete